MKLEKITVNIRPRSQWEAIDVGLLTGRRWFVGLWLLWLGAATPVLIVGLAVGLLVSDTPIVWGLVIFWLVKPLYEPPLLLWISRALFGEQLSVRHTFTEIRRRTTLPRIVAVLMSRLTPYRLIVLPVLLLEGLSGKTRRNRTSLLNDGCDHILSLTGACFFIELFLTASILALLNFLIPHELQNTSFTMFFAEHIQWLMLTCYVLSCSLVAPFYTTAAFMLYINRRVELEAWDIELGFKKMNQRLSKPIGSIIALLLISTVFFTGGAWQVQAQSTSGPEAARTLIAEITRDEDFGREKTIYRWVPRERPEVPEKSAWLKMFEQLFELIDGWLERINDFLAGIIRPAVFLAAGCLAGFLLFRYRRLRSWLTPRYTLKSARQPPSMINSVDIRPTSLPDDISLACGQLLSQSRFREALSLLYRATLSQLVYHHQLSIQPSATERDCRTLVRSARPPKEASFFDGLTHAWLLCAYGHQKPDHDQCDSLLSQWRRLYQP
jgi:hypothetical protein